MRIPRSWSAAPTRAQWMLGLTAMMIRKTGLSACAWRFDLGRMALFLHMCSGDLFEPLAVVEDICGWTGEFSLYFFWPFARGFVHVHSHWLEPRSFSLLLVAINDLINVALRQLADAVSCEHCTVSTVPKQSRSQHMAKNETGYDFLAMRSMPPWSLVESSCRTSSMFWASSTGRSTSAD